MDKCLKDKAHFIISQTIWNNKNGKAVFAEQVFDRCAKKFQDEINRELYKLIEEGGSGQGKDGKTPVLTAGDAKSLPSGNAPTVDVVYTGNDAQGNPIYRIDLGIPVGKDGTDGNDGNDGITPELRLTEQGIEVSYNNGATWTLLVPIDRFAITNNITNNYINNADEEDITVIDDKLKFADKTYDANQFSGLGRIYLRKNIVDGKNILTQSMINATNTIYIIQYDYDLNGATITIPDNCTLYFEGGSLSNGILIGNKTNIVSENNKIFADVLFRGFDDVIFKIDWFVDNYMTNLADTVSDATIELQSAFVSGAKRFEFLGNKYYYISNTITLSSQIQIIGIKNRGILSTNGNLVPSCIFSDANITMLDILVDNEEISGFRQVVSIGGFILLNRYKSTSYNSIVDTSLVRLRTSDTRFGAAWGIDLDFDIYGTNFNIDNIPNEEGVLVSASLRNFTGLSLEAYNNNYLTYVNVRGRYYNLKRGINVVTDNTSSFVTSLNLYHDSFCDRGGDINASPVVIYGDHQCFRSIINNGIGYFNTNSNNVAIIGKIWDTNAKDNTTKLYAPQYGVIDTNVQCQIANISNSGVKTSSPLPHTLNYANLPTEILNTLPNMLEGMLSDKVGINDNTTTIYNSPVSLNNLVGSNTIDFTSSTPIDINTVVRKDNMFSVRYIQDRGIQANNIVYGQLPCMTTNYPFVRAVIRLNTTGAYIPFTQIMNSVLLVMMPSTRLRVKLTRNNVVTSTSETITILDYDTSIEASNTVQYYSGNVTEIKLRPYTDFLSNAFGNTTIDIVVECSTNLRGTYTIMPRIGLISTNANNVITRSGGSITGRLVQWDSMFYSEADGTRYIRYNYNPLFKRAIALQGNTISSIFKFRVNKNITNPIVVSLTTDTGENIQLKCIWEGCTASGLITSNIWVDKYEDSTFYYYNVQFRNLLRTDVYPNHIDTYGLLEFLSAIPSGLTVVAQDKLSSTLYGTTINRPLAPTTGSQYYDTTLDKPFWWNGSSWITYPDSGGSTMAALTFTGAVEATYNGSTPVTVNIPTGGGGGGEDGKTPVMQIGNVTTVAAGGNATADVRADGADPSGNPIYKVDFGIPRGSNGTDGDDGASAGFGEPTASAETVASDVAPSVVVTATGANTSKVFDFAFKIPKGKDGTNGNDGDNGLTPTIGENGNWMIGAVDTGVKAKGEDGLTGKTPVFETGEVVTGAAGTAAIVEVVINGVDETGNPKYLINFTIPRGADGTGSGGGTDRGRCIFTLEDYSAAYRPEIGLSKILPAIGGFALNDCIIDVTGSVRQVTAVSEDKQTANLSDAIYTFPTGGGTGGVTEARVTEMINAVVGDINTILDNINGEVV